MSTKNANEGVVILSSVSINSNQAAHSNAPPPTVSLSVRLTPSMLFLDNTAGSSAHLTWGLKTQVDTMGTTAASEGCECRGIRRA